MRAGVSTIIFPRVPGDQMFTEDSAQKKRVFRMAVLLILVSSILTLSNLVFPGDYFSVAAHAQAKKTSEEESACCGSDEKASACRLLAILPRQSRNHSEADL